jgi:hypothetical protein
MLNGVVAAACYIAGALLFVAYNLFLLRKRVPEEMDELEVVRKYWRREWAALLLSFVIGICYILALPELSKKSWRGYSFTDNLRWVSILAGALAQWIVLAGFGVSKKYIDRRRKEIENDRVEKPSPEENSIP